jgi:hypothetical protein
LVELEISFFKYASLEVVCTHTTGCETQRRYFEPKRNDTNKNGTKKLHIVELNEFCALRTVVGDYSEGGRMEGCRREVY